MQRTISSKPWICLFLKRFLRKILLKTWDLMKKKYQGSTRVKQAHLQALQKEFEVLHMKDGEIVNEYFARVVTVANKMKVNGENKSDVEVVKKILRSRLLD